MSKSFVIKFLLGLSLIIIFFFFIPKFFKDEKKISIEKENIIEDINTTTNIIKDVNYSSKDVKGNEYILNAYEGQIDLTNNDIIFLTDVIALIRLKNSENIKITSRFGKYNIKNYDTIFSKNVLVKYLDNNIKSEYLDFSILRDTMIISNNVTYKNITNVLNADVIEMNLTSKDVKIFMHSKNKKVNVKSLN